MVKKLKASDVGTNILCEDRSNGSKSQSGGNDRETHSEVVVTDKINKRSLGETITMDHRLYVDPTAQRICVSVVQRLILMASVEAELNTVPQPGINPG